MILGVTGGIASGKSTVCAYFTSLGIPVLDADAISRELTAPGAPGTKKIGQVFGAAFIPGGTLDRKKLAAHCFASPEETERLNGLLHPMVIRRMKYRTTRLKKEHALVIWDVPLLFESGMETLCDKTLTLTCSESIRVARVRERDGLTEQEALARIRRQLPDSEKAARADYVLPTDGDLAETLKRAEAIIKELTK